MKVCHKCGGSGFVDPDALGDDMLCYCPIGRALDREFEAATMNVCCICGRPSVNSGCETCASMMDESTPHYSLMENF